MPAAVLDITDSELEPITISFGTERDAAGQPVTDDPIASAAWTIDDVTIAAGTVSADTLTAVFTPSGKVGTATVTAKAVTQKGVQIVGTGILNVGSGPVASVDLVFTQAAAPSSASPADASSSASSPATGSDSSTSSTAPSSTSPTLFTFSGDASTVDATAWPKASVETTDGQALYTWAGAGDAPVGNGWTAYTGPTQPVPTA